MNSTRKVLAIVAIASAFSATALDAQATDARWQAWIGCWAPVDGEGGAPRLLGGLSRICVTPGQTASAVEILTITSGKVLDRTRIDADGVPHQVSRDGCTGTEMARWAATGTRLYITTDVTCTGGVRRAGNGVMSFTQRYEWLDVRGMNSREASGVAVARYAATDDSTGIPAEVRNAMPPRTPATNTAMLAAASPLTLADIADVATMADSGVAATWLMERTQGVKLAINGKQLEALADHGVPSSIIDVVVAIAHPNVFALNPASRDAEFKAREERVTTGATRAYRGIYGYPGLYGTMYDYPFGFGYGWSPYSFGYGSYNPYYGYGFRGYGGYYSPYSYGYYPGSQPIVVVTRPSTDNGYTGSPHGRVVKGQGYTSGDRSSGSSGGSSSSSSGGSGGSTGGASAGAGSSGGGGARTAVKKP